MKIKSNQRVVVVGKTGSGKSYWTIRNISKFKRVVFFDPKHEHSKNFPVAMKTQKLSDLKNFMKNKEYFILYQPFEISEESFNELCKICFKKGNVVLCLDEVERLKFVYWHEKIIRMGRKRGVGIWHLIQRPSFIPSNYILSESDHLILFKLNLKADRNKIAGIIGEKAEELRTLKEFHYLYYNVLDDEPTLCKPIK